MTKKDLCKYAEDHWSKYLLDTTTVSYNDRDNHALVTSEHKMFCFDHICASMFCRNQKPASTDGLIFSDDTIWLVEFKTGFKQKITKDNFDENQGKCITHDEVCREYWGLFFRNQEKIINELISSIKMKAIESVITLEKKVLPLCCENLQSKDISLELIVVIDEDEIDI